MHTARVKRLPVINERGQLLGTVSRADLLKVPYLVRAVHHVEGVVRVESKLSFDVDDDPAMAYPWMRP
jgi:CBS-domain-containing membrane protein